MSIFGKKNRENLPTRFGYVPPAEAVIRGWECSNLECGRSDLEPDRRRWPKSCPECGSPVGTGVMQDPWEHYAKRFEIDARL
jgi:hypothetical protein